MPEKEIRAESQHILGQILNRAFDTDGAESLADLIKLCDDIPYCREVALENANERLTKLLNSTANTQFQ